LYIHVIIFIFTALNYPLWLFLLLCPNRGNRLKAAFLQAGTRKGRSGKKGDILFSYETDKASFEAEAEGEGILLDTFFADGDEIAVLTNVAVIGKAGESPMNTALAKQLPLPNGTGKGKKRNGCIIRRRQ